MQGDPVSISLHHPLGPRRAPLQKRKWRPREQEARTHVPVHSRFGGQERNGQARRCGDGRGALALPELGTDIQAGDTTSCHWKEVTGVLYWESPGAKGGNGSEEGWGQRG